MIMQATSGPYTTHKLSNGLDIIIEDMPGVRSTAAGFLVKTGARDETPEQAGVSHFLEHMMFKGTAKRSWREITVDFDRMGSSYNAFTSEERTVYYGWVPAEKIGDQIELLADMMQAAIPPEEFDMEKNVILEEIAMSKDSLEHTMFDFLQEKVFSGHSLAWPILGYDNTVGAMTRETMWHYFRARYAPDNMALIVAGRVVPEQIIALAEQHCGHWKPSGTNVPRVRPAIHGGVDVLKVSRFKQQVIALTFPSIGAADERIETAAAVSTILGGDNSRFFWHIVQKGLAPRAGAYHLDYSDCGCMILYAVCQPENVEKVFEALRIEANRICTDGVQEHEVARVKNKRRTGLAVEGEAPYHRLGQLMEDLEYRGRPRTVEEMLAEVDAVSIQSIGAYLRACPLNDKGHLTSVGPREWPTVA
jgi:predicted Zn-dependent peptidase